MSSVDGGASPQPSTPHSPVADQWDGPSPEEVVARRSGDVLLRHTILKGDHFPGCQNMRLRPLVDGAPNFRQVPGLPVYGVAIPTVSGVRRVLDLMGAARGARRVLWHSLREEPVIYVNGAPFVVREADKPFANLEYTGIDRERVEAMEARLKLDVLQEAQRYGNQILVAEEDDQFQVVHTWQPVSEADVQTTAEVYRELAEDGYDVDYLRVPVTDEKAPKGRDFDTLIWRCWRPPSGTALVFNCQMGRGRTTTGMVIGSLLALRAALSERVAAEPGAAVGTAATNATPHGSFWDGLPTSPLGAGLPDWFVVAPTPISPPPGGEPDLESELQAGNWGAVRSLVRVLEGAGPSKTVLDVVVDACSAMQNLRSAIAGYRDRVARERNDGRRGALLAVGTEYLERYFGLIVFAAYVGAPGFDPERSRRAGGFARWAAARVELGSILSRMLRMNPLAALALSKRRGGGTGGDGSAMPALGSSGGGSAIVSGATGTTTTTAPGATGLTLSIPATGDTAPVQAETSDPLTPRLSPEEEEIAAHRAARSGSVLGPRTLLKQDHAPGCQSDRVPVLVPGAPNLRELRGMRVWGGALPTVAGMRGVLDLIGAGPSAPPSKQCHAVWTLMREEPMVYLNGAPYVLRESSRPFKNLMEYRGIGPERLEGMEERLRTDVQDEASARGGRVLVTREEEEAGAGGGVSGGRVLRDELVTLEDCATPRAVAQTLRAAGYRVTLVRIPITDGSAPRVGDLDAFYSAVAAADPADALVYTCQLGGGRTTLGMVIGGLLRRAINGAVLGAADVLPSAVVQLDEDVGEPEPPPLFMRQSFSATLVSGVAGGGIGFGSGNNNGNDGANGAGLVVVARQPPTARGEKGGGVGTTAKVVASSNPDGAATLASTITQDAGDAGFVTVAASDDEQVEYRVPDAEAAELLACAGGIGGNGGPLSPAAQPSRREGSSLATPFARVNSTNDNNGDARGNNNAGGVSASPFGRGSAMPISTPTAGRVNSLLALVDRSGSITSAGGNGGGLLQMRMPEGTLADQEQANLWAGEYKAVRRLVRTLERGGEAKATVDSVVDAAGTVINLRASIQRYRVPRSLDRFYRPEVQARHAAFARGGRALERYCLLIALASYLQQCREHGRRVSFAGWWASRPDVRAAVEWIHADPASALAPVPGVAPLVGGAGGAGGMPASVAAPAQGSFAPGHQGPVSAPEERAVLRKRRGAVVGRRTILKSLPAALPGACLCAGPGGAELEGVTDLRAVTGCPVYTLGNATVAGLRALLTALSTAHGGARIVVTDLREELVLYVGGTQYIRREVETPAAAAHHAGVQGARLEALERQLRFDVMAEAAAWGGHILLHREVVRPAGGGNGGDVDSGGKAAAATTTTDRGAVAVATGDDGSTTVTTGAKRKAGEGDGLVTTAGGPDPPTAGDTPQDQEQQSRDVTGLSSKRPRHYGDAITAAAATSAVEGENPGDAVVRRFAAAHGVQGGAGSAQAADEKNPGAGTPSSAVPGSPPSTLLHIRTSALAAGDKGHPTTAGPGATPATRPPSRGDDDITQSTQYQSRTEVQAFWAPAGAAGDVDAGVCTAAEVFAAMAAKGVRVAYRRVPLSRERTPAAADLDALSGRAAVGFSIAGGKGASGVPLGLGGSSAATATALPGATGATPGATQASQRPVVHVILGRSATGSSQRFAAALFAAVLSQLRLEAGRLGNHDALASLDNNNTGNAAVLGSIAGGGAGNFDFTDEETMGRGGSGGIGAGARGPYLPPLGTSVGGPGGLGFPALAPRRPGGLSPLGGGSPLAGPGAHAPALHRINSEVSELSRSVAAGEYRGIMNLCRVMRGGADAKAAADTAIDACAAIGDLRADIAECAAAASAAADGDDSSATPAAGQPSAAEARRLGLHYLQRYFLLIAFMGYMAAVAPPRDVSFAQWMGERREQKYLLSTLELE